MAQITLNGKPIHTNGELPAVGAKAPDFDLTGSDLKDVSLADYKGQEEDTEYRTEPGHARVRNLNAQVQRGPPESSRTPWCSSCRADLPFASKRFCTIEGLQNVLPLSLMRGKNFAEDYGVLIEDGPLAGISARAVVVLDENDRVVYRQLVPEIEQEPDYDKALAASDRAAVGKDQSFGGLAG